MTIDAPYYWRQDQEYPSLDGPEIESELALARSLLAQLDDLSEQLPLPSDRPVPDSLIEAILTAETVYWQARAIGDELLYLGYSEIAVDSTNRPAQLLASHGEDLLARLERSWHPIRVFLQRVSLDFLQRMLNHPDASRATEGLVHVSKCRTALAPDQLSVLTDLEPHGLASWQRLYKDMLGSIRCHATIAGEHQEFGSAQVFNLMQSPNRADRQAAWEARNRAWEAKAPVLARGLSAITGWQISTNRLQYPADGGDLLHALCHSHRFSRSCLDRMLETLYENRSIAQRGLEQCAQVAGLPALAPWDLISPDPDHTPGDFLPLEQGLALMEQAFETVMPQMGAFIRTVKKRHILDARDGSNRRPGGFSALMPRTGNVRVFSNWAGSRASLGILAHEMGHGFHFSTLEGQPYHGMNWPPSLEETPSTFAELAMADVLIDQAETPLERRSYLWQQLLYAAQVLLGSACTFHLELAMYDARKKGSLGVEQLDAMSEESSRHWYGEAVSPKSKHRWLLGRHYYVGDAPFNSVRYLFSYLLAQALMARRQALGSAFSAAWLSFLDDLGQGSVDTLLQRHFDLDPNSPEIWETALARVRTKVDQLESIQAAQKARRNGSNDAGDPAT